ncbi:MAG: tetracycline repressor protein class H [Actinobacteria bacterium HGW-Actinobacteria-6]|jgi:AcrR family transcriptional regulator|nr:MAG: tetracycline repressor protein class H [Actinobacteria bacterium HGW-Actinobacteria-6]
MAEKLTRERLIAAALTIVDRDGLDALSMRKLGAELGVDPMAAYRHLPNKEALLDGVIEAVAGSADIEVDTTLPWQGQLQQLIRANLKATLAHPNVLPLLAQRPLTTPGSLGLVERSFQIMVGAGIPLKQAALAINTMGLLMVSLAVAISSAQTDPRGSQEMQALFASLPREEFPNIVRAIETGQFIESHDEILDFWTGALIERLERTIPL